MNTLLFNPDEGLERAACSPRPIDAQGFNASALLPYELTIEHIRLAMSDFVDFLGLVNKPLNNRGMIRIESMLMPANFSSMVGEFMVTQVPTHCSTLAKNQFHNGHPDLVPAGRFPGDAVQHSDEGIEVKGSRYTRGWQGHNPEDTWLMVFVFDSNRPVDPAKGIAPKPFRFRQVLGARLVQADWAFACRSGRSRRTITASVTDSGYQKMAANWIYRDPVNP